MKTKDVCPPRKGFSLVTHTSLSMANTPNHSAPVNGPSCLFEGTSPVVIRQEQILSGLAHDARNLLSAIQVYCELIASPGVLTPRFRHYADDLHRLGETGSHLGERLIEALAMMVRATPNSLPYTPSSPLSPQMAHPFAPIHDLAFEVEEMRPLLAALTGPEVRFEMACTPCPGKLGINSEDLLRILFNLVANAAEAIDLDTENSGACPLRATRFLRITAQQGTAATRLPSVQSWREGSQTVLLSVRDSGPGIDPRQLGKVFDSGFSTRDSSELAAERPRGLGLSIVQQLVRKAGGVVRAVSSLGLGTRFDIELPILDQVAQQKNEFRGSFPMIAASEKNQSSGDDCRNRL